MRRFLLILLAALVCAGCAQAQELMKATDAVYAAVQEKMPGEVAEDMAFVTEGSWLSATFRYRDTAFTRWLALIYDMDREAFVAWEDIFADGDGAAEHIAALAEESTYDNAYSEHNQITPVPRDSFALDQGQLFVYYPPEQLSHFSGRAGAYAFYAYELEGFLKEGAPLVQGDMALAGQARDAALEEGALPGMLAAWAVGSPMEQATDALGLVDVPDYKDAYAVWHFEAPQMRGVSLLSGREDDQEETAVILGIHAQRIDFSGLRTGVSTKEACEAALGAADQAVQISAENEAYALYPAGWQLIWTRGEHALVLHFTDDVLHSVTVRAATME